MNFQPSILDLQPGADDLQHAQLLRAQGRRAAAHGADLRYADDGRRRRAELVLRAASPKRVDVSDDGNVFTFHLRDGPRFHDGSPLTADDVAFSLMLLKDKGHPTIAEVIRRWSKAEASDPQHASW